MKYGFFEMSEMKGRSGEAITDPATCFVCQAERLDRFGEGSVKKMRTWAQKHLPPPPKPLRILECGCGNGTLLLSFLTSKPASSLASSSSSPTPLDPQLLHLTGIDYSPLSLVLAQEVEDTRREAIIDEIDEEEGEVINDVTTDWRAADLLRHNFEGEVWDLVMDKGTFDALCLSDEVVEEEGGRLPSRVYPEKVSKLVKEGGFFLITSCNFTEEEIKARWTVDGLGRSTVLIATSPKQLINRLQISVSLKDERSQCRTNLQRLVGMTLARPLLTI